MQKTKIVKSVRNIWNNDRVVWNAAGYGYAHADFDGIRGGTRQVTFTDGTVKAYQITSEDDPSEWLQVGDTVTIYNENPYDQQPADASSIPF